MGCMKMCVDLIDTSRKRGADLAAGLNFIMEDLDFIKWHLVENKELHRQPLMQLKLQELAYGIDDFVHGLWIPGPCGAIALSATGLDPRQEHIVLIEFFKGRAKALSEELAKGSESTKSGSSATPAVCSSSAGSSSPAASPGISFAREEDLVGIAKPKEQIVDLLSRRDGHMRVISIVGRSGLGKSALARALYEDDVLAEDFDAKAWVVASDHSPANILDKILQELHLPPAHQSISEVFRQPRRYLVFLDGVQRGTPWEDIQDAFRENDMDSRIIVTTTVPSIARACSSGSYVYTMEGLDKDNSRKLFRGKFWRNSGYTEEDENGLDDNDVDIIIDKCDGLPIALISAAKCLRGKGQYPRSVDFKQVSQELHDCLACSESDFEIYKKKNKCETAFVEMRRALVEPYENLLNNGEKDCLLYVSIFPSGQQINSKSLVRRLIAEGLGPGDPHIMKDSELVVGDVRECLRMLMDHHMIESVPIRNCSNAAKRCRVHSIMLEFTIKKAVSRNFVSLIQKDNPLYNTIGKVRRLSVQSSTDVQRTGLPKKMGLSFLRSLAILNSGVLDFEECKTLRVLDLEGCCGLTPEVLHKICGLLFLKYLSLRNTDAQKLPENVKELECLETLDTRETGVKKLPVEVIMLPRFAHLFGKLEVDNVHTKNKKKLTKFFSEKKSQLHTLAGISVDKTEGLEILVLVMQHARYLKRVKLWCKDTASSTSTGTVTSTAVAGGTPEPVPGASSLADILKKNLRKRCLDLESVSIDFNGAPNSFLGFLKTPSPISSIKLWKGLGRVPSPAELRQVRNLKKLHLFSTGCSSEELGALQYLQCLQYLKLAEDADELWDSIFHVKVGGFKSLIWLCFEASKHPPVVIEEGALTLLASLQLLCPEGGGFVGIPHLAKLNEVILHRSASDAVVKAWKEEAKKHINRPYVEKQQI